MGLLKADTLTALGRLNLGREGTPHTQPCRSLAHMEVLGSEASVTVCLAATLGHLLSQRSSQNPSPGSAGCQALWETGSYTFRLCLSVQKPKRYFSHPATVSWEPLWAALKSEPRFQELGGRAGPEYCQT